MKKEVIYIVSAIWVSVAYCCVFPKYLQGTTWYKNIRDSTRTAIYFRDNIMESQLENVEYNYISDEWSDTCVQKVASNAYIISHDNSTFSCVVFINRSLSVIQLKISRNYEQYSTSLCEQDFLYFDKWLLVSIKRSQTEFTLCPFSGGYNMKIRNRNKIDHPCNFMDLPMRFESECHKGEGVIFDFRTNSCKGDIPMNQVQKAFCVTSWRQDGDVLSILRNPDTDKLWCLRIPARRTFNGKTIMFLFTDLTCTEDKNVNFYQLELELVSQNSLCIDEHNGCHRLPCTDYFVSQCLKSCGMCDPNVYPTACTYPRRIRGEWSMNDAYGSAVMNISGSRLEYSRVGTFSCVSFKNSPPSRKTKQFTTVSYFNNGCRPRYTCVSYKRMNPNVFGFAFSQSKTWPLQTGHENVWADICKPNNFNGDPTPIGDTFRTYNDVYKPMIAKGTSVTEYACPLRSSYMFNATLRTGGVCAGRFYKVCQNPSQLRIDYDNCPFMDQKVYNFVCLGLVDSKYWETIILLQNALEPHDTSCLILSDIERARALILPSGECDHFSWTYVDVGLRQANVDFIITPEMQSCRFLETTTAAISQTSTPKSVNTLQDAYVSNKLSDLHNGVDNQGVKTTHKHRHHNNARPSTEPSTTSSYQYRIVQNDSKDKVLNLTLISSANIYSFAFPIHNILITITIIFLHQIFVTKMIS